MFVHSNFSNETQIPHFVDYISHEKNEYYSKCKETLPDR